MVCWHSGEGFVHLRHPPGQKLIVEEQTAWWCAADLQVVAAAGLAPLSYHDLHWESPFAE